MIQQKLYAMLAAILTLCGTAAFASCTSNDDNPSEIQPTIERIVERGKLLVGTTGDYRPLSYKETDGDYWGFGIEIAGKMAERIGVGVEFVQTSWPTLTADVLAEPQTFDLAIGGITITEARKETMLMSDGYLCNGKTILCRANEADRYQSLADIDKPEVRVMVNPGGLNEKFANENLPHATIIVYQKNEEIPNQVAEGNADVMITEITEAPWYVKNDTRLAAPLLNTPFTHGEIGVLMRRGQDDLLVLVNSVIAQMKTDGSLRKLHEKYGQVYGYTTPLDQWQAGTTVTAEAVAAYGGIDKCFAAEPIPDGVWERMQGKTFKENPYIGRDDLRHIRALHWDYDNRMHVGEMVCNVLIADRLVSILHKLFDAKYPIQRMLLPDVYDADDETQMRDNNSSCFCYRNIAATNNLSKHARGLAVDINTLYNPYIKTLDDGTLLIEPATGEPYCDRTWDFPYKITHDDLCFKLFTEAGFEWGGDWTTCKDYQHFEISE